MRHGVGCTPTGTVPECVAVGFLTRRNLTGSSPGSVVIAQALIKAVKSSSVSFDLLAGDALPKELELPQN